MKKYSRLFIFLLFAAQVAAQPAAAPESLLPLLAHAKEDTNKVKLLLDIEKSYFTTDLDSALYYNQACEKMLEKINDPQLKHRCYHEFVKIYHAKFDYKSALNYCLKSLDVARLSNNRFQEATSCRAIFNIYHNLRMNDSAVKYGVYALKLTEEIGDTSNIATNFGNLCWLYLDLSQYEKAVFYGLKGIEAGERYKDSIGLLISMNNVALTYQSQNKYAESVAILRRQLAIAALVNRPRSVRNALTNLASACYSTGDAKGLNEVVVQLNAFNSGNTSLDSKSRCYQLLDNGYNYIYQKKFKQAEEQLLQGMKLAEQDSVVDAQLAIYVTLSQLKFAQHDFAAGSFYESKWDDLYGSNHEKELSEYGAEMETKYETEKKEQQLKLKDAQLKTTSVLNYVLIGTAFFLLVISLLSYRTYRQKQKLQQQRINELEIQQQLTATEAILKGEAQERARLARDLHDGLGGMLSGIKFAFSKIRGNLVMTAENNEAFERSLDMLDGSIKEMRRVAHNMMPEALIQYGLDTALRDYTAEINKAGMLQVVYQSMNMENKEIDSTVSVTIYRIVQELLNNIVKHAGAGKALLQLVLQDKLLLVTVEDDGKGLDRQQIENASGIGWKNIRSRVEFLKGSIDIQSAAGKGLSVNMEFNVS